MHLRRDAVTTRSGPGAAAPASGSRHGTVAPGFVAGVLGGVVMAAWMVAAAALDGLEPLAALRPLGDTFADLDGREGGAPLLAAGVALHLLVSGAVGVLLAVLLPGNLEPRFASVLCVGYAFAVMAVMTSLVLPAYNPSMRYEMPELGGAWVVAHAAYGATTGWLAQVLRQRSAAPRPTRADDPARAGERPAAGRPRSASR